MLNCATLSVESSSVLFDVRPVRTRQTPHVHVPHWHKTLRAPNASAANCNSTLIKQSLSRSGSQLQFDPHQTVIIQVWHNTVSSNLHVTLAWIPKALRNGWRGHLARQPELGRGLVHARHQVPSLLRHDELKPSFVNHRTHLGEVLRLKP